MKEIGSIIFVLIGVYLLLAAFLYVYQRKLIYYPTPVDPAFIADEVEIDNDGTRLHGWVLNPGKSRALIYFGGNSELITHRREFFETVFSGYSVYLINYRGFGRSQGQPSESGLFSDALAIYDHINTRHRTISAYGRSLGSGVAVYLASKRPLDRLILLTPYDSVTEVAQRIYPIFPVRYLIKDRFDSASLAPELDLPVLMITAEHDHEITLPHSLALKQRFSQARVTHLMVTGAAHNDIVDFPVYRAGVADFIAIKSGDF